jgi:hypothetical protein
MGDCDSLKKQISDYLEGNLDNSARDDFERCLKQEAGLQKLTNRVGHVSEVLSGLPVHNCSSDFSVKLRERIHHSATPSRLPVLPVRKYSYAFSFVVITILAVFTFNQMNDSSTENAMTRETPVVQSSQPAAVTPVTSSGPESNGQVIDHEVEIKTKGELKTLADSLRNKELDRNDPAVKYVGDKE